MKHRFFHLLLFIFICSHAQAVTDKTFAINSGAGGVYTEEFFTLIYQTQLSPYFKTGISYFFNHGLISYRHKINLDFYVWNMYYKNNLLYFTDKTLSADFGLDYRMEFTVNKKWIFKPVWGPGFNFITRYDSYSLGTEFHYSQLRILPVPTLFCGLRISLMNMAFLEAMNEFGCSIGMRNRYLMDSLKYTRFDISGVNTFSAELKITTHKNIFVITGWKNRILVSLDLEDIAGRIYWSNTIYGGIEFEIKHF